MKALFGSLRNLIELSDDAMSILASGSEKAPPLLLSGVVTEDICDSPQVFPKRLEVQNPSHSPPPATSALQGRRYVGVVQELSYLFLECLGDRLLGM